MFIVSVLLLSYQGMFTKLGPFKEFPNLHNKIHIYIYIYTCDHIITCIAIDTTMCGSYRCIDTIKHIDIQKICRYNSFGNHARQTMFFLGSISWQIRFSVRTSSNRKRSRRRWWRPNRPCLRRPSWC